MSTKSVTSSNFIALMLGSAALFGLAHTANADPTAISGLSPFAGCFVANELTFDQVTGAPTNANYLNAEVEPWIDVNPANPNNIIAGWQQDRWSDGGARSLLSAYSMDGGTTWTRVLVPGINKCAGGSGDFFYDRATDPWIAFSPNGAAYFFSLAFNNDLPNGGNGANAMLVSRSTNGGASWGAPQVLIRDTDVKAFNDKNAITADPNDSRYVFAVWDRLYDNSEPIAKNRGGDGAPNARARRKEAINRAGTAANFRSYEGPAYFARTVNGGQTWEAAKEIYNPGTNSQTIGNQVAVTRNGDVFNFYMEILHNGQTSIGYVKSTDHGATFGGPVTAVKASVTTNGTITPDSKASVRDGNILFDLAIDHANDRMYLVWQDGQQQNIDRVAFSMSADKGVTWSAPAIINKTPKSTAKLKNQSFVPSVEVGANGKLYVTYYDFRNDTAAADQELTDYFSITCTAGCQSAASWGGERRLTPTSFNMLNAPIARGHFLGDYQGLIKQGANVRAVFGIAVGKNLNEIVTTLIP
jgi:hypothetical protein